MSNTAAFSTQFAVGDTVYLAAFETEQPLVVCPDCRGQKIWWAFLPSGEWQVIDCPSCKGMVGSHGVVRDDKVFRPMVRRLTIGSVRINTDDEEPVSYMAHETGVGSGTVYREGTLFADRECAEAKARILAAEGQQSFYNNCVVQNTPRVRTKGAGRMAAHYRAEIRRASKDLRKAEKYLGAHGKLPNDYGGLTP